MKTIKVRPKLVEAYDNTGIKFNINIKFSIHEAIKKPKYQLIFVSLDDIIDNNKDRYFESSNGMIKIIVKAGLLVKTMGTYHSIVTLQPQIPESYIKQFIEEYNKNAVKDVEIEMIESNIVSNYEFDGTNDGELNWEYLPKLTNGFVTIVNNRLFNESDINKLSINIEQPLYTEQEVILLLDKFINEYLPISAIDLSHKWFEDHKKK